MCIRDSLDSIEEVKGKIFVDIGSAEGFTSLEVIEKASHIYLFEQDKLWIEALNATFGPVSYTHLDVYKRQPLVPGKKKLVSYQSL